MLLLLLLLSIVPNQEKNYFLEYEFNTTNYEMIFYLSFLVSSISQYKKYANLKQWLKMAFQKEKLPIISPQLYKNATVQIPILFIQPHLLLATMLDGITLSTHNNNPIK